MNDDAILEQVHERLLTAELATVLANERPRAAAWQPLWVAAMVLLGAFVAVGVAWLAHDDHAFLQEREFDPVDPWYEHEWPWRPMVGALQRPGRAAEAPEGVDEFVVTLREEDSADLAAVLDRPAVRRLALCWRNDQASPNVAPELWQRITTRPELEVLMLSGCFVSSAERLRELRLAPALRYVVLFDASALDGATAQALVELPRLRGIGLVAVHLTTEGLAALAGLPHLDTLLLSRPREVLRLGLPPIDMHELMRTLPKLRNLRALVFEGDATTLDAPALRPLADMKHLRALDLSHVALDDAALAALPSRLELLALSSLDGCTAEGLGTLRRLTSLRTLRLRSGLSAPLQRALLAVLGDLSIERFDSLVAAPDAATWKALQAQPKLRWLELRRGSSFEDVVAGCRACEHLEVLTLFEKQLPTSEQLAPLCDHPTLRRIRFHLSDVTGAAVSVGAERLAALRASVRAQIEVMDR